MTDSPTFAAPTVVPDEAAEREADLKAQIKAALAIRWEAAIEEVEHKVLRGPKSADELAAELVASLDPKRLPEVSIEQTRYTGAAAIADAELRRRGRGEHDAQVEADAAAYQKADPVMTALGHTAHLPRASAAPAPFTPPRYSERDGASEVVAELAHHGLSPEDIAPPATAPKVNLDHLADTLAAMRRAESEAKQWTETAKALRAIVEHALGEREVGTVAGKTAVTWKYTTSHRLDQAKLKAAEPKLFEQYTVESHSRRFLLAGE